VAFATVFWFFFLQTSRRTRECLFMKRSIVRAALLGSFLLLPGFHGSRVLGQGISPVIVEYEKKATEENP
jgi:hypothetical protein